MTIAAGTKLGRYEIRSKIGAGGMGEVYLAQDTKLDRKVALKILPAEVAAHPDRMKRFVQEAKTASALNHPNIITIYEIEQIDSVNFIATEFIDGETLRERMRKAPMKLGEVLDVAVQMASALAAAHAAGIVHRDIKPENVMLRRDGIVKVLDFGLAKLSERTDTGQVDTEAATKALVQTEPGVVMGTAAYMSPEQARGLLVDARTDIFSLGVVIYEMVTGQAPFGGATRSDLIVALLERDPPPLARFTPEAPTELERLVMKTLAKDREERYQSAKDLLIDLKRLKEKLKVDAEIERTAPPELPAESGEAKPTDVRVVSTAPGAAAQTAVDGSGAISSVEYIVSEIRRHKKSAGLTLATLAIIAAAAVFFYFHRATVLTEKDTILIADFVNTTGDSVFDGALKQALAIQLEQSPFLNIFTDERMQRTLRLMGRSPDVRVTWDVAREICERQGLKAMIVGSIAPLGSHYVIGLEAVNAHTGDVLARAQEEAESKEQVLSVLRKTAMRLREKLGESLSTIQKFDAPIEQVTTSSLEALKAFSLVREQRFRGGNFSEAIATLKRAIELDPKFARAYAEIAVVYGNLGQLELDAEYAEKAYQLRERANEREKMLITANYYASVTGELDKSIETLKLWVQTYPRDAVPHQLLSVQYVSIGQSNQGIEEARQAIRLDPDYAPAYLTLTRGLIALDRFDEAREGLNQALARKLDSPFYHRQLYLIGFVQGDSTLMKQQLDWFKTRPDEYQALNFQAQTAAFAGRLREARLFSRRAVALAKQGNLLEAAAQLAIQAAMLQVVVGLSGPAKEDLAEALTLSRGSFTQGLRNTITAGLPAGPMALALSGEVGQAQSLAEEMARRNPNNTVTQAVWLPVTRAAIELQRSHPDKAIELLQSASQYETGAGFWPIYLRGQAYLRLKRGAEAAAEFQKILDHRGRGPASYLYPLAHLGLARAAALTGDAAGSRKAYQDFLALWKDADADLPILIEAKMEYEKVR